MNYKFTEQEEAFRKEVREFFEKELGTEYKGWTPQQRFRPDFSRKLGKRAGSG
jgi:alkylation response protein AidB-like acyl-CoA dehydrogenase